MYEPTTAYAFVPNSYLIFSSPHHKSIFFYHIDQGCATYFFSTSCVSTMENNNILVLQYYFSVYINAYFNDLKISNELINNYKLKIFLGTKNVFYFLFLDYNASYLYMQESTILELSVAQLLVEYVYPTSSL